jgi:menaquinone-specific isochorismate synthase
MPALSIQDQVTQRLTPLLRSATRRSARLGRPVLASYTGHLGPATGFDPASIVSQPDAFIWEQPDRGFAMASAGQAVRIVASGEGRFEAVRRDLDALLQDAALFQESGATLRAAPVSVGGFSFDPQRPDEVAWFGYPDALIAVPRITFTRAGSHLFLTVSVLTTGETEVEAAVEDLAILARRLFDEAHTPAP